MTSLFITHRQELAKLGLNVTEISYGTPWSPGFFGIVLREFQFRLVRRDETFSPALLTFLHSTMGLSSDQIQEASEASAYGAN